MMKTQTMAPICWIAILLAVILASCDQPEIKKKSVSVGGPQNAAELEAEKEQAPPTISEAEAAELIKLQKSIIAKADLTIPDALTDLPEWMTQEDIPFDTDSYFEIDQDRNGGRNYLRAVAYAELHCAMMCLPSFNRKVDDLTAEQKRLFELDRKFSDARYGLMQHLFTPSDTDHAEYFTSNIDNYLKRVEPIVAELKKAQQFPSSSMHRNFAQDGNGTFFGFRVAAYDLSLLCRNASDVEKAVETIRMTMDLGRALRKLGSGTEQITSVAILRFAINEQLSPVLKKANDPKQLDQIIEVLHQAHLSEREMPRFLEHAKFEHLQLRQLLHELQTDTLEYDAEAYNYFGIGDDDPTILKAHKLLTTDFIGGYVSNEEVAIEMLEDANATKEQLDEAIQLIEESRASPLSQDAAAGMIISAVMASVDSMSADDFRAEVEVLKHRYEDIVKCSQLPYPEQIDAIATLQKQWTKDQRWERTKFLRWYRPHRSFAKFFVKTRLMIDGYLSLACVKKFQLENGGRSPGNVKEALKSAGIDDPENVIDPYTGTQFKIAENKTAHLVIYSVGPDRKDDRGEKVLTVDEYRTGDLGDVLLSLQ